MNRTHPKRHGRIWLAALALALLVAALTVLLAVGALRDPTRSLHGLMSTAIWTTFGPHLVLLSVVALMLGAAGYRRGKGRLAVTVTVLGIVALLGSTAIVARIVSATSAAGGSANPMDGLWLRSMTAARPDETVTFTTVDGVALRAAVFKPLQPYRDTPVLLYIHGGGFMTGSFLETAADLRWFANQGWLVLSVEYRLWTSNSATWNKAPQDVACAAAWAAANAATYGGDATQLALLGDSAGGNLAINVAYAAALGQVESACGPVPVPAVVVVQYPAVDPMSIYEHGYPVSGFEPRMLVSGYIGGDPHLLPDRVRAVSSATYLSDKAPPTNVDESKLVRVLFSFDTNASPPPL
jgi:acetyl esterase/lipase